VYSFRDSTRFAAVYFADRSNSERKELRHISNRVFTTGPLQTCLLWSFPLSALVIKIIIELLLIIRKIVFNRIKSPKALRPGADLSISTSVNGKLIFLFPHLSSFYI